MFDLSSDKFSVHERKLKELKMRSEEDDAWLEKILHEHKISKENLFLFLADSANFDEETWKTMQDLRLELKKAEEGKFQVKDPSKTDKKYKELNNANAENWILVR